MKRKMTELSQRYASALQKHLKQGPDGLAGRHTNGESARQLGREAARLGMETLDVARIHEGAVAALGLASSKDGIRKRAEIFFAEAITPIEEGHRGALNTSAQLKRANKTLDRRTSALAASNRSLKQSIGHRKKVEDALKKSEEQSAKLMEESRRLQKHLRHLTQKILKAQEDKRKKLSRDLQDEIAQTLLGINVRLLTLRKEAVVNAKGFKKEIAGTQRLADKAEKNIKKFAREIGRKHRP
jgi:signal transduction histidine kinase